MSVHLVGGGWSAEHASAEKGEQLLEILLPRIAAALHEEGVLPA